MPVRLRLLLPGICLAWACACTASAAERYEGLAYARESGDLLYRELHYLYREHGTPQRLVLYRCPRGDAVFARKQVDYGAGAIAPDFNFVDARAHYREGVATQAGERHAWVQTGDGERETRAIEPPHDAVIDAGFDAYIRKHWQALAAGRTSLPFLIPSRFGFLDFAIVPAGDGLDHGRPVRTLRMSLDAWYGFLAPDIEVVYLRDGRRLLRFEGPGTIRGDNGKPLPVRIEFPPQRRGAADADEIAAAAALALAPTCE